MRPDKVIIDEFGELDAWLDANQRKIRRHKELKDRIKSWYDNAPPEQEETLEGTRFDVQVGPKTAERRWRNLREVLKAMGGIANFLPRCTISYKAVAEAIGEPAADALQIEERVGSRRLRAVLREAQAKVA